MAALRNWKMGNFLNLVYDEVDVIKQDIINYFGSYVKMDNFKAFDINEVSDDGNKYYYFYEYRFYLGHHIVTQNNLPFSEKVINLLKNNRNFYIIVKNDGESDDDYLIEILDSTFKKYSISTRQLIVINCNERNEDLKIKLKSDIVTHTTNNGKFALTTELKRFPYNYKAERNFMFMSYNRKPKIHRFALLTYLMKHRITDETDWSWIRGYEVKKLHSETNNDLLNSPYLFNFFTREEIVQLKEEINELLNIEIKKSIYEEKYEVDYPPHKFDTEASYSNNPYGNSYINIVTETNFDKDDIIILSEKSFIPLYFSQIPIIMASTNHIKKMRDRYGFDFFDDIVNHDYDSEPDPKKRFKMIIDEILRMNTKKIDIITFFKKNKFRFDKNVQILENIINDKTDYNFYNSLI